MIQIEIRNIFIDIVGGLSDDNYHILERRMSFRPLGYQFSPMYNRWIRDKNGKPVRRLWDGWRRQIWKNKSKTYFPTGLFSIVKEFLIEKKIKYALLDYRIKPEKNINIELNPKISLRDYQIPVAEKSVAIQRGLIQAATGSGKTVISAKIIELLGVSPFIFFVTSIDLLLQAKEAFEDFLLLDGKPLEVGQIGGGVVDIKDINVMTVQTAVRAIGKKWDRKYKFDSEDSDDKTPIEQRRDDILNLLKSAKGVISDECQHWKAETCQLVARSLDSAYYTYGCSATPWRDAGDDILIDACFGKKIAEISASELIRKGWLIKPSIKIVHIKNEKSKFKNWQQIYKEQVVENESYHQIVADIANGFIKNNRLVLVLVQQISHGKKLESLIPGSTFLSGASSKEKRQSYLEKLRNKEILCIISSVIFDEGVNVKALDTLLLTGQGKSSTRALQRIGRILRPSPGKTIATAIDFRLYQKYLLNHSIEREKIYKTEEEFEIEHIEI